MQKRKNMEKIKKKVKHHDYKYKKIFEKKKEKIKWEEEEEKGEKF